MSGRMVVTGGAGALGSVLVQQAEAAGWRVATIDRHCAQDDTSDRGVAIGGIDLADDAATSAAINIAASRLGGVDALVNVAGGFAWSKLEDAHPSLLWTLLAANTLSSWNIGRAGASKLGRGGRIVHVGAAAVGHGGVGMGAYTASKAAVMELVRCHASDLAARGITVNAVLPAIIDTLANREAMPEADPAAWTSAETVADVILSLASPAARGVTGALIPITNPG